MKKCILLYLCAAMLLTGGILCLTSYSSQTKTQRYPIAITQDDIIWNATDYNVVIAQYQPDLGNITVTPRIIIEYEDLATTDYLFAPDIPSYQVSPRVITEYADAALQLTLRPQDLNYPVTPRILFEYADYSTTITAPPYLGPQPYPNDTSPPDIVVVREPSGPQVPENQNVVVSADVTDVQSGVKNATLQYTLDDSSDWSSAYVVPMSLDLTTQPQDSLTLSFNTTIQGQSSGTRVRFRITAYDFAGNSATIDGVIDTTTYLVVSEYPSAILLPLLAMTTLCGVVVCVRCRKTHSSARQIY